MRTADAKAAPQPKSRHDIRLEQHKARERFGRARIAERDFAVRLRQVARAVGGIVAGYAHKGMVGAHLAALTAALDKYATLIRPWATVVVNRMLADVSRRDEKAWHDHGQAMGRALRKEIAQADTGVLLRKLQADAVDLIQSLPKQAAQRVHKLVLESLEIGRRPKGIAREIMRSGKVCESRALLIATTEVARASSLLTQARALSIGCEAYRWRTAKDQDVRPEHRKLEGKVVMFNAPPVASADGTRAHAGQIYRCRCFIDPILPDLESL